MPSRKPKELKVKDLTPKINLKKLKISSSLDIDPCKTIIGQDRAVKAIKMGLRVKSKGYNIFVTGLTGTGRMTTIKHLLQELDTKEPELNDVCYVNNFKDPGCPKTLIFKAGVGRQFKRDIEYTVNSLRKAVPKIFVSEDYKDKRNRIAADFSERQKKIIKEFEKKMSDNDFVMVQVATGMAVRNDIQPVIDGEPTSVAKLDRLVSEGKFSKEKFDEINTTRTRLQRDMDQVASESKKLAIKMEEALEKLDYSMISPLITDKIKVLKKKYPDKKVAEYLDEVEGALLEDLDRFKEARPRRGEEEAPPFRKKEPFEEFAVNLILDNSETDKAPVVVEFSPSYRNLFGTMERIVDRFGYWRTDFSRIRGGSLLNASGGFLIINAVDLFTEPGVWKPLKRTLMTGCLEIAGYDPFYMMAGSGLKPEPIPINIKVVLIGESWIYRYLWAVEEDFKKIFKVKSEFDYVMEMNDDSLRQYASFTRKITDDDNLPAFKGDALEEVIAFGSRMAGRKNKISTQFTNIADLIREAGFNAIDKNRRQVTRKDVKDVIQQKIERLNLIETKVQEMYDNNTLLVDTSGKKVGQINGLAVYGTGEYMFGRPARITARVSVGRAGVVNIEREADLSGPVHNKGVLVLTGYLRGKFAHNKPLVMSASICFEQSYSGIDGDSASSTEIYAILSALSNIPIDQGIAVTGSVNQYGEIQPIGGVNQKIEGFYEVCKSRRLTGKQGVLIPVQNVAELQLKEEVVEAVKEGKFHIYPIETVDQGIEILTGKTAGRELKKGGFTKGSIFDLVDKALDQMARQFKASVESEEQKLIGNNKKESAKRNRSKKARS
jgi:lon-related putative ATP-dependent protease